MKSFVVGDVVRKNGKKVNGKNKKRESERERVRERVRNRKEIWTIS